jgi:hypothetical protein
MKKPSSKIREEITRLQEQLKAAETREAERIGRIALKAGLGELGIEEGDLQAAFEEIAGKFRKGGQVPSGTKPVDTGVQATVQATAPATKVEAGAAAGRVGEA